MHLYKLLLDGELTSPLPGLSHVEVATADFERRLILSEDSHHLCCAGYGMGTYDGYFFLYLQDLGEPAINKLHQEGCKRTQSAEGRSLRMCRRQ